MRRQPLLLVVLIVCLFVGLAAGYGLGHAVEASLTTEYEGRNREFSLQISSLRSQVARQDTEIGTMVSETQQIKGERDRLAVALQARQAEYDALLAEQAKPRPASDAVSLELGRLEASLKALDGEYRLLQESHVALEGQYGRLEEKYKAALQATADGVPGELAQAREQVSSLQSEVGRLKAQVEDYRGQVSSLRAEGSQLSSKLSEVQILNSMLAASLDQVRENVAVLTRMIGQAEADKERLNMQVAQLTKQLTPSPDHAIAGAKVWGNPEYRSVAWSGRDYELQSKIEEIGRLYHKTHTYIIGQTDCNDMAVDLWNMLFTENIKSVIVIGHLQKVGETFLESDHAWLYVFNSEGKTIYLEPTTGEVFYGLLPNSVTNPKVVPYREGYIYQKPSDLWADLKKRW